MRTLVVSGGEFNEKFIRNLLAKINYDFIIAVDRGLWYTHKLGLVPSLIVGDFDSVDNRYLAGYDREIIRQFRPEKDDTDTEIAMREAVKIGNPVDIVCATGGRVDHLLGNIHVLKIALDAGIQARLIDGRNVIMLKDSAFEIEKENCQGKYFSLLPFEGTVSNIKLKGFKYNLDGYDLKPGVTRCISNEITDSTANVEFDKGVLIVINSSDVESE